MRHVIVFGLALLALSGSLVAALATQQQLDRDLRGYVDPTRDAALPFRVDRLGVNADLFQYSPDELDRQLELMRAAHIVWVRQTLRWDMVETEPGVFDWSAVDQVMAGFDKYPQLQPIVVLLGVPEFASDLRAEDVRTAPPEDPLAFAEFAEQVASRYGDQIDYYQIWDEPNLREAWGMMQPSSTDYAVLLQSAYNSIHGVDADAMVIAAALAPTAETGPLNIAEPLFLDDLYRVGLKGFSDAIATKPYGFGSSPADRTVDLGVLNFSRIVMTREVMVQHDDAQKAVWVSNFGWNALPDDWSGEPSIWGNVSLEAQIDYTHLALGRIEREWPWVGGAILHRWQPDLPPNDPQWGFSLVTPDDQPTPLLASLTERPAPHTRASNGLFPADTKYARYSGVWTFSDFGADIGWLNDSYLQFDFAGRDLALLLRQGDYVGYIYPTIDGEQANALPQDAAGNAYTVLTSDTREPEMNLVPVARNLPTSPHTLEAAADRGWDQWSLAGYAVSSGDLAAPYHRQIRSAWIAAIVSMITILAVAIRLPWRGLRRPANDLLRRLAPLWEIVIAALASLVLMFGMLLTWGDGPASIFRREPVLLIASLITGGLVYIEPGVVVSAMALLVLFVLIFQRIEIGLTLTVFWAPFFLFPVELFLYAFPVTELLIIITGAAWGSRLAVEMASRWQLKSSDYDKSFFVRIQWTWMDACVAGYVVLGMISIAWADYPNPAMTELRVLIFEPALFYVIARTQIKNWGQLAPLVNALILSGGAVAIIGLAMYVQGENIITAEGGARRLAGVYGSPNNVALYLGRVIPFALAYLLIMRRRWQWIGGGVLAVSLIAVALTQSAGGLFIGVPLGVATVLILAWRRRSVLPLMSLSVLGAAAFAFLLRYERFNQLLDFTSGTNFRRLRVWSSSVNVLRDHPLTGLGLDQFLYAFQGRYIMPDAWQEPDLSHPHNILLDFWIRLSVLGAVLLVLLQVIFWRNLLRLYDGLRESNREHLAMVIGGAGAMINLLGHGLVDNSVFVNDLVIVFFLLLIISQVPVENSRPK